MSLKEVIIDNLIKTFKPTNDINNQIKNSEAILFKIIKYPDFFPSLFEVIKSSDLSNEIKGASLIYFTHILEKWSTDLSNEEKTFILNNINDILSHSFPFLEISIHLATVLVECSYFTGYWNNLPNIILKRLENLELDSIILLNSIARHYKYSLNYHEIEKYDAFYPLLKNYIEYFPSYRLVGLCFQAIRFFNKNNLSVYFKNSQILSQFMLKLSLIENFQNNDDFKFFSKQIIKFCGLMIQKYKQNLDVNVVISNYHSVYKFFNVCYDEGIMNSIAKIIYSFLFFEPSYKYIIQNLQDFIQNIVLRFFILNEDDFQDSIHDIPSYLAKFQTKDFLFGFQSRGYFYNCIENKSSASPELCFFIFEYICTYIQNVISKIETNQINDGENAMIFSHLSLFSSIINSLLKFNNDSFYNLINMLWYLLQSSYHLIIAGALLCIKNITCFLVPSKFFEYTARLLNEHPSLLVQYYSAITLSENLKQINNADLSEESKKNKETIQNEIVQLCSPMVIPILKSYINLSSIFNDFEFIDLISSFLEFFGYYLVDISSELVIPVFEVFLHYQSSLEFNVGSILDSLLHFICLVNEQNTQIEIILNPLFFKIYEIMNYLNIESLNIIFEFIGNLLDKIHLNEPNQILWKIFEMIPATIKDKGYELLENGCFALSSIFIHQEDRDNIEVVSFILDFCNKLLNYYSSSPCDELIASIQLLTNVFLYSCPNSILNIKELFSSILQYMKQFNQENRFWEYFGPLFLSMLRQNFQIVYELLDENFFPFCYEWFDTTNCILQMYFFLCYHENIPSHLLNLFLEKIDETMKKENSDFSDLPDFFDVEQIASNFLTLITKHYSTFISVFEEDFENRINSNTC